MFLFLYGTTEQWKPWILVFPGFGILFIDIWYDSLKELSARRKVSAYTEQHKHRNVQTHSHVATGSQTIQTVEDNTRCRVRDECEEQ
jgi:hypothetical protein